MPRAGEPQIEELDLTAEHKNLLRDSVIAEAASEGMSAQNKDEAKERLERTGMALIVIGLGLVVFPTWYLIFSGEIHAQRWFTLHPPFQTLSMIGLLIGITPVQPPTPAPAIRETRLAAHQKQILRFSLPMIILGTAAIWWNKAIRSAQHIVTWHGFFGMVSVIWMIGQAGMGVGMAWYGKELFGSELVAKTMYKYHRICAGRAGVDHDSPSRRVLALGDEAGDTGSAGRGVLAWPTDRGGRLGHEGADKQDAFRLGQEMSQPDTP